MSEFVTILQQRIEQTKGDLEQANQRMHQASADVTMLTAELQGYERALSAEMRRAGLGSNISASASDRENVPRLTLDNDAETSKSEFALHFIQSKADSGTTPAGVLKAFEEAGIPIKKTYIYSLIGRLQKRGLIRSRRNKWFPETKPAPTEPMRLEMIQ
jgi:hypothetical protein